MLRKRESSDDDEQEEVDPYPVPNPEWTPKQEANWREYGQAVYNNLQTDIGRKWYRKTYRPKMRVEGMMTRDHVELGTAEDYINANVEDRLEPMGDMTKVMMRELGVREFDIEELETAIDDIVQAKLHHIKDADPDRARRIIEQASKLNKIFGTTESDSDDNEV